MAGEAPRDDLRLPLPTPPRFGLGEGESDTFLRGRGRTKKDEKKGGITDVYGRCNI